MRQRTFRVRLLRENAKAPARGTPGSAGLDFYSPMDFSVPPRGFALIPLGVAMELPDGVAMIMKERSGVSVRTCTDVGACVIDPDYRGEVHAHLFNNSDLEVRFKAGDRVCQGVLVEVWMAEPVVTASLNEGGTRGEGGFGSTGE